MAPFQLRSRVGLRCCSGRRRVLADLPEMSPHRFAGSVRIAPLYRFQDSLMVELAALRASIHSEDPAPLLAQQAHDRIEQGENQRVADGFGQSQVKVKVSLN